MSGVLPDVAFHHHLDGSGPWSDIVVWSRADLCRNYEGLPFPHMSDGTDEKRPHLHLQVAASTLPSLSDTEPVALAELDRRELLLARESGMISASQLKSLAAQPTCRSAPDAAVMIRTQDRDHVRLVSRRSGLDSQAALRSVLELERTLGRALTFAYDDRFGYLTAEPARCGTGLALGCLVHLPALAFAGTAAETLNEVGEEGLSTRGWFEEDGRARGDLFILRSRRSLGRSEKIMAKEFTRLVARIVGLEVATREILLTGRRLEVEDRIHRAAGLIRHARLMSLAEAYDHVSLTRLGTTMGILAGADVADWNRLLVDLRPGHLGLDPVQDDPDQERCARAVHLRKFLP